MLHLAFPLGKNDHRCTRLIKLNGPFSCNDISRPRHHNNVIAVAPQRLSTGARRGDSSQQGRAHSNRRTACEYHVSNSASFHFLLGFIVRCRVPFLGRTTQKILV
jgi:hypothetical protein